jgi:hypothetical protein
VTTVLATHPADLYAIAAVALVWVVVHLLRRHRRGSRGNQAKP